VVAVVWQIDVRPSQTDEFERFYGVDGPWTKLSRKSRSFLGSSFLKDILHDSRYLLIEYWSEMVIYEKHLEDFRSEARSLERERTQFVVKIESVGLFNALNVPTRSGPTWSRRSKG
jgi:pullulanase/glycogen debranching enzyme